MLFSQHLVVVRGGGDLGTGAAWRVKRAGFPVVVLELGRPLAIRRRVAFASAVMDGPQTVEGVVARLAGTIDDAVAIAHTGDVAVLVDPGTGSLRELPSVVVDARLAKHNIDTTIDQAPLVVGLGPGFTAGVDCHAVVETMRGHRLGRVMWDGCATPDTGVPGSVGGERSRRVVRSPGSGRVIWQVEIGALVDAGDRIGTVGETAVESPIAGAVRGLVAPGHPAEPGLKIADIDPRADPAMCFEISDKSRSVGGGVLEAILTWLDRDPA